MWVAMWVEASWQVNLSLHCGGQLVRHTFENGSSRPEADVRVQSPTFRTSSVAACNLTLAHLVATTPRRAVLCRTRSPARRVRVGIGNQIASHFIAASLSRAIRATSCGPACEPPLKWCQAYPGALVPSSQGRDAVSSSDPIPPKTRALVGAVVIGAKLREARLRLRALHTQRKIRMRAKAPRLLPRLAAPA